jgi:hypothetical protein
MSLQGSPALRNPEMALPTQLGLARQALADSQRVYPPGTARWRAVQVLIEDIDALLPLVQGERQSRLLNLNCDSELSFEGQTSRRLRVLRGWRTEVRRMKDQSIEEFVEEVRQKGRIGKYDVQAFRDRFLRDGLASRAEADLLIALDRDVESVHFSWPAFFIAALTEFAVWQSGHSGYIDNDKSRWLLAALGGKDATNRGLRALASIAKEAECFAEAFFASSPARNTKRVSHDEGAADSSATRSAW